MPLSEVHRPTTNAKPESTQSRMTNSSSDVPSYMPDHEFVELLWENGQIVMQSQSNRPRKSPFSTVFPSHTARVQEKDSRDASLPKAGRFPAVDSMNNDLSPAVPTGNIGLNAHDDDMVPWMNYPIEDSLQNDYCSDFLSEISGVNLNSLSTHHDVIQADRGSGLDAKDFHNVEHGHPSKTLAGGAEPCRVKTSQLFQMSQSSISSAKPRPTDFGAGTGGACTHHGQLQKHEAASIKPLQPSSGIGLMNFSHFSRPVTRAKTNLPSINRWRDSEKAPPSAGTNPVESALVEPTTIRGQIGSHLAKGELRSSTKPHQEVVSVRRSEAVCQEDSSRKNNHSTIANNNGAASDHNNHQSSSFAASMALGRQEAEKGPEAVVASSSVCSGNSAGAASTDPKQREKRKNREGEESGYQSEDLEDESVGLKKPATGRGGTTTKRSRAAEVHNLSERRRRDRINEKMRALQELIPNCNKVDKASMLDEAIEYLKTLQLQVQMMSMGSGLCMPPMMLPHGMQHLRGAPMAHFSPMGVGMGMGMGMGLGFGMGMVDMNGSPLMPVPPMHTPQFPCPPMPGSTGLQLFGIPGQGLPVSMPRSPLFGPLSGLAARGISVAEVPGVMKTSLPVSDAAPSSSSKDQQQQSINIEAMQNTSTSDAQALTPNQTTKGSFKKSQLMQMDDETLHVSVNRANNSVSDPGNATIRPTSYG